ncbi:MAG TPA: hypothetical protein VKR59_04555 [Terriglobales bacterium]|nr:hypothetical protein [Terriglobales bacterium]
MRLSVSEKKARGTNRADRETVRSLEEVRQEIADALEGVQMMPANLTMAAQGIRAKGMYLLSRATNNKGEVVTTERLNPAFKVQREAMAALKGLRRALVLLREEEQTALAAEQPEVDEFEGP